MRLLVVEDEQPLADGHARGLVREGFAVDVARDGHRALELAADGVVRRDPARPEAARGLRATRWPAQLRARGGLDAHPGPVGEGWRVRPGRRAGPAGPTTSSPSRSRSSSCWLGCARWSVAAVSPAPTVLVAGGHRLDPAARTGRRSTAEPVSLTPREFRLLEYLMTHAEPTGHQDRAARARVGRRARTATRTSCRSTSATCGASSGPHAIRTVRGTGFAVRLTRRPGRGGRRDRLVAAPLVAAPADGAGHGRAGAGADGGRARAQRAVRARAARPTSTRRSRPRRARCTALVDADQLTQPLPVPPGSPVLAQVDRHRRHSARVDPVRRPGAADRCRRGPRDPVRDRDRRARTRPASAPDSCGCSWSPRSCPERLSTSSSRRRVADLTSTLAELRRVLLVVAPLTVLAAGLAAWYRPGRGAAARRRHAAAAQAASAPPTTRSRRAHPAGTAQPTTRSARLSVTLNAMLDRLQRIGPSATRLRSRRRARAAHAAGHAAGRARRGPDRRRRDGLGRSERRRDPARSPAHRDHRRPAAAGAYGRRPAGPRERST